MKHRFYTTSEKAWDAMFASVSEAKQSVYWEIHTFLANAPEHDFLSLLERKAREGIHVVLIIDSWGSSGLKSQERNGLLEAGVEVRTFRKAFHGIHKKVLIIDKEIAYLGGVNVGREFKHWLDLNIMIQGPVIQNLLRSFGRSYKLADGQNEDILKFYEDRIARRAKRKLKVARYWVIDHAPALKKQYRLREYYERKINKARKSLVFVTPYFLPHRWMVKLLKKAIARGVRVEVIMPKATDIFMMRVANDIFWHRLKKEGLNFYLSDKMIHAKALLVDGREGFVGSNNIDALSFNFNTETGLVFKEPEMLDDLKNILEAWKKDSILLDQKTEPRWYKKPVAWLVWLIHPFI
jgi:cardiolipin synthase A/B